MRRNPLNAGVSLNFDEMAKVPNAPPIKAIMATTRWIAPCHEMGVGGTSVGNIASRIDPIAHVPSRYLPVRK